MKLKINIGSPIINNRYTLEHAKSPGIVWEGTFEEIYSWIIKLFRRHNERIPFMWRDNNDVNVVSKIVDISIESSSQYRRHGITIKRYNG